MENISLRLDADTSEIIAKLNQIENRFGSLERAANELGAAKTKALNSSAGAAGNLNKNLDLTGGLMSKLGGIAAGIGVAAAFAATASQVVEATKQMESFQAAFTNAFSKEGANSALVAKGYMEEIRDIASKTPFEFEQLAGSILKLTNQGFEPTREEIIKLGDLASTTGRDFGQLAEAVLDAQTGEFERLKEFGIRASKANGEVTLSFKGQTKVVQDNDQAIRNAIISYGEMDGVQGAMAAQAATLGGQLSNLSDAIFQVSGKIGERLGPVLKDGITGLVDFIGSLDVDKIFAFFSPISDKLIPALEYLYESLVETAKALTGSATEGELMQKVMDGLSFAFGLVVDALVTIVDYFAAFSNAIRNAYQEGGIFTNIVDSIGAAVSGLGDAIKYILEGLQKLYLGEDEYNKRQLIAAENEKQRAAGIKARAEEEQKAAAAYAEHKKKLNDKTDATKKDTAASKDAEKALKEYQNALKSIDKVIDDFNKKREKAIISTLTGEEKIEAERKLAQKEIQEIFKNEDEKAAAQQSKYKEGSAKYKALQEQKNLLTDAYLLLEKQTNIVFNNEKLAFQKEQNEKENKLLADKFKENQEILDNDLKGSLDFIKQQSDLQSAEIDLRIQGIEAKKNIGEDEKAQIIALQQEKLQLQIGYLVQQRNILAVANGENSTDVLLLDNQIKGLKIGLQKLENDKSVLDPIKRFKAKLGKALGLNDEELNAVISGVQQAAAAIGDIIAQSTQARLDENQKLIDSLQGRISETESALKKEEELKAAGYANNVNGKIAELKALQDEEAKALAQQRELKKNALKRQLAADLISQASSTAVAAAGFFAGNAPIPVVGAVIAAAGITSMIALVAKFRSEAKALETSLYTGGSLSDYIGDRSSGFISKGGSSDKPGMGGRGYKIQGTNVRVGGNEFLMNENTSILQEDFLQEMNKGSFDRLDFNKLFAQKTPSLAVIVNRQDKIQRDTIFSERQRNDKIQERIAREQTDRLIGYWKSKPDRVTTNDGYIEFKEGSRNRVRLEN